ncbi:hypothetical protein L3X38_033820 [Prunus dulcis]|uniref:RING-type E3 ubiquitin transferase n=1 Tax=Prunus dulcis TaxID=3755 RepID=A0AAD4VIB7_PRUDU|nr:hypothetical protein L3X38_033820 [Prunus dulcis]
MRGLINCFSLLMLLLAFPYAINAQATQELQNNNGYGYVSTFTSSMAMILVFLVCAFFLMAFFIICIRRCAEAADIESAGTAAPATVSRRRGLDPAVIETFPILVYSAVKDLKIGKGALECAVCLGEFDDYETLRLLPKCDHVFHPDCIDAWLAAHVTCPVCRTKLSAESNSRVTEPHNDPNLESSSTTSQIEVGEARNDAVVVNVYENQSEDPQAVETANRTSIARSGISGKFPRSHSTGHSLSQLGGNTERYTLRLPEEVRRQLISLGINKLRRSNSYDVVLPRLESSRKGYRCGGGEAKSNVDNQTGWFDSCVLLRTPSFLARGSSVTFKFPKGGGGDGDGVFGKTPLRSVKTPFDCLNAKAERSKESISRLPV